MEWCEEPPWWCIERVTITVFGGGENNIVGRRGGTAGRRRELVIPCYCSGFRVTATISPVVRLRPEPNAPADGNDGPESLVQVKARSLTAAKGAESFVAN